MIPLQVVAQLEARLSSIRQDTVARTTTRTWRRCLRVRAPDAGIWEGRMMMVACPPAEGRRMPTGAGVDGGSAVHTAPWSSVKPSRPLRSRGTRDDDASITKCRTGLFVGSRIPMSSNTPCPNTTFNGRTPVHRSGGSGRAPVLNIYSAAAQNPMQGMMRSKFNRAVDHSAGFSSDHWSMQYTAVCPIAAEMFTLALSS